MAQEVISSAILIIAGIIATAALVNAVYPSVFTATDASSSASSSASDRVRTDVKIAMASKPNATAIWVWVKNVGSTSVPAGKIPYTDVYFGEEGGMLKASANQAADFRWGHTLEDLDGDGDWSPGETLRITIADVTGTRFTAGDHQVKLVLHNAASFEDTVTI